MLVDVRRDVARQVCVVLPPALAKSTYTRSTNFNQLSVKAVLMDSTLETMILDLNHYQTFEFGTPCAKATPAG